MKSDDIYTATAERLQQYGLFSEAVIKAVARVARQQSRSSSYDSFFASLGMPKPILHTTKRGVGVPVVDIPARKVPRKGTVVIHLPFANPLDENQLFHIATVAAALPKYRVIGFGNPSGKPYNFREQRGSLAQWLAIALTSRRRALVAAELDYLQSQGLTSIHHIGYSYGVHKALIEALYLQSGDIQTLTLLDPVAHPRRLRQLIGDFRRTLQPMGGYVDRTNIPAYFAARHKTATTEHPQSALRRPISWAIGMLMARFDFVPNLKKVLQLHPRLRMTIAWGSQSELGNDAHMKASLRNLRQVANDRITPLRLKGDKHAFGNDIHLYAAIVCTGVGE